MAEDSGLRFICSQDWVVNTGFVELGAQIRNYASFLCGCIQLFVIVLAIKAKYILEMRPQVFVAHCRVWTSYVDVVSNSVGDAAADWIVVAFRESSQSLKALD